MTNDDRHLLNKVSLRFRHRSTEAEYQNQIQAKTLTYCRIAWLLIVFLGAAFAPFDRPFFGDNAAPVIWSRGILAALAVTALALTWVPSMKRFLSYSSALFILLLGAFSIVLIAQSDPTAYSPYFTATFFAFAGIFSTAGMGFAAAVTAQLVVCIAFAIVFYFFAPLTPSVFIMYNAFLPGIVLVFAYCAYLIERTSREMFAVSDQLRRSLDEVRQLSGLLPICAHCKKIRDDQGYWNRIEEYIHMHSKATFTHSICPDCVVAVEAELDGANIRIPTDSTP